MNAFLTTPLVRKGSNVGNTYGIPLDSMTATEIEEEKQNLTVQAKTTFGKAPPPFCAWGIENGVFHMPRLYV